MYCWPRSCFDSRRLSLQRDYQIHAQGLFDTEIAAGFLALPGRGLSALLERFFGLQITKQFQMLDWSIRPLSEEALAYAATDVRHLVELKDLKGREKLAGQDVRSLIVY